MYFIIYAISLYFHGKLLRRMSFARFVSINSYARPVILIFIFFFSEFFFQAKKLVSKKRK